jgi:hypothetical protein
VALVRSVWRQPDPVQAVSLERLEAGGNRDLLVQPLSTLVPALLANAGPTGAKLSASASRRCSSVDGNPLVLRCSSAASSGTALVAKGLLAAERNRSRFAASRSAKVRILTWPSDRLPRPATR